MVLTIAGMSLIDAVHPPAVSTSLSFAFRAGDESNLLLFGLALSIVVVLVLLQRGLMWMMVRLQRGPFSTNFFLFAIVYSERVYC